MKRFTLLLCLLACVQFAVAKEHSRKWQDAVLVGIDTSESGSKTSDFGGTIVSTPITIRRYQIESAGLHYVLRLKKYPRHPPNLTVNGHTKLAVESTSAYILDEDGKEFTFEIVSKAIIEPAQPQTDR